MKKLFLLPIVILGLCSCATDTPATTWIKVSGNEVITVFYGSEYRSYFAENCDYLAYQHSNSYQTIKVKYHIKEQTQKVDTYMGNNLNIVVWENWYENRA